MRGPGWRRCCREPQRAGLEAKKRRGTTSQVPGTAGRTTLTRRLSPADGVGMSSGATITKGTASGRLGLEVAALAGALYVVLLIVIPLVEPEFDVWRSHPEDYAAGSFGALVNLSYAAMAIALVSPSSALLTQSGWKALALVLLVPPALLCVALTVDPIGVARQATVAPLAILGLGAGPVVVSIVYRRRFGQARVATIALGALVALSFVALALAPESLGGGVNRVFDVLAGAWIVVAAIAMFRA